MVWPGGTANSGKGLSTLVSLRLQRSAISMVRSRTAGESLKEARHFFGALDKKLVAVEFEAVGLVDFCAGLHAEHYVVGVRVFTAQVVRVVGGDERNAELALEAEEVGMDLLFFGQALVLNFEVEIALAEDVLILTGRCRGFFIAGRPPAPRKARRSGSRRNR